MAESATATVERPRAKAGGPKDSSGHTIAVYLPLAHKICSWPGAKVPDLFSGSERFHSIRFLPGKDKKNKIRQRKLKSQANSAPQR